MTQIIINHNFNSDKQLIEEILAITSESFNDSGFLQEKHFKICDTAYLIYNDGELTAFLLCNWGDVYINKTKGVYMGFAAVKLKYRKKNYFSSLILNVQKEAKDWCAQTQKSLFLYGFTANPLTYNLFNSNFEDFHPKPDLSYSEKAGQIAHFLIENKFKIQANAYPFLFKNFVKSVYTKPEIEKIKSYNSRLNILSRLDVRAENGDRLLILSLFNFNNNPDFT